MGLEEIGIGTKLGSEKYGDILRCQDSSSSVFACFSSVMGFGRENDEEIDPDDVHCDDGDSDLDDDQDWREYLSADDEFSTETKLQDIQEYFTDKGIGKVKQSLSSSEFRVTVDTEQHGSGAFGKEGGELSNMFRSSEHFSKVRIEEETDDESMTHSVRSTSPESKWFNYRAKKEKLVLRTYGPGNTRRHPWTGREDGGINSRSTDGKIRLSEIYFAGTIDILQQYNHVKSIENFAKGVAGYDRNEISAVPAKQYAERFIKFLDDNIV